MKRLLIVLAVVFAAASTVFGGDVFLRTFSVEEDSSGSTLWRIGDSTAVRADFDTSIVYDSKYWDNLTFSVKGHAQTDTAAGGYFCCGADSGASTVVVQQSNDGVYWTPVDSALAVDSLAFFKNCTLQHYAKTRFVVHHAAKTDSSGVRVIISAMARGLK